MKQVFECDLCTKVFNDEMYELLINKQYRDDKWIPKQYIPHACITCITEIDKHIESMRK